MVQNVALAHSFPSTNARSILHSQHSQHTFFFHPHLLQVRIFTLSLHSSTRSFSPFILSVDPSEVDRALIIVINIGKEKDNQLFPIPPTTTLMYGGTTPNSTSVGLTVSDPTSTPLVQVTEELSKSYYKGLPFGPRLVATTRPWATIHWPEFGKTSQLSGSIRS